MMIKRVVASLLALAALTWAGPASSAVADDAYVAPARVSVSPAVIEPGGRSTITFSPGFFESSEMVGASVSGRYSSTARVVGRDGTESLVSDADGGMVAIFIAPPEGLGPYSVTFSASRGYTAIVTVVAPARPGVDASEHKFLGPDLGVQGPGLDGTFPGFEGPVNPPTSDEHATTPPDREGRIEIPGDTPQAPAWPNLTELPWGILLLAAVALVVSTVAVTLLVVARRR